MIAVMFELWPAEGQQARYLSHAANLRPALETVDGFISVERFASIAEPGKFLSLSFFRTEAAVAAWRNRQCHRATQTEGRAGMFIDYRLRVARVLRDYGLHDRNEAPADSQSRHPALPSSPVRASLRPD